MPIQDSLRVLVVDDDKIDTAIIQRYLEKAFINCLPICVSNLEEAQQALTKQSFDICLLDYNLGATTGLEVMEFISADENHALKINASMPVIMLSNLRTDDIDKTALQVGVSDFLSKDQLDDGHLAHAITYAIHHTRQRESLRRLAHIDPLTGVANRLLFQDRFEQTVIRCRRHALTAGLMFLDVDHFKKINDTHGHEAGDWVLKVFAQRLKKLVRANDTVARLGGDEFAILLEDADRTDCKLIANKILQTVQSPIDFNGLQLEMTTSIGVTLINAPIKKLGKQLLNEADSALYQSKRQGRGCFTFYRSTEEVIKKQRDILYQEICAAIDDQHLVLYYQPVVHLESNKVDSIEALVRWPHPNLGLIFPSQINQAVEKLGLNTELLIWALQQAANTLKQLQAMNRVLPISVNIGKGFVDQDKVIAALETIAANHDFPLSLLQLEFNESAFANNAEHVEDFFIKLKNLGVGIVIDDFGTGLSSISFFSQLPIDSIKIDIALIRNILTQHQTLAAVKTIFDLANNFGIKAIAKGVETIEQYELLTQNGCEYIQGELYYPAMVFAHLEKCLNKT